MGRFHCVESDCTTVWVKTAGSEPYERVILGDLKIEGKYYPFRITHPQKVTGYEITHKGNYCFLDRTLYETYYGAYIDADFEIISGEDSNYRSNQTPQRLTVPRMQVKRLIMGWEIPAYTRLRTRVSIWFCNDENPDHPCDWQRLDPRNYGGSTAHWNFDHTNIVYHSADIETCSIKADFQNGDAYEDSYVSWDGQGYQYRFDGRDCFDVTWTRIRDSVIIPGTPDTWEAYKIEKLPYVERLEVVDFAYETFGFNLYQVPIPDECLNIYLNDVTGAVTIPGVPFPANPFYDSWEFIAQFCSEPGQGPPEYYVICGCQEECPEGTCEVDCSDHICCYGSDGVVVTSIPKV